MIIFQNIKQKLVKFLNQGLTPRELALTIAVGMTLGIFPVVGLTSILCTLAAVVLRLNLPVIQSVNWAMSLIQITLLIPFSHFGAMLFGGSGIMLNLNELMIMMETDFMGTIEQFMGAVLRGIAVWCIIAGPLGFTLYVISISLITRVANVMNIVRKEIR